MAVYAYVRVSNKDQNEERQLIAVQVAGVNKKNIFIDKQSGKDFNRPAYKRLLKKLKPNDTLIIKSIDRLGRNYTEILEQWRVLTKDKGVFIVVLDLPLLDTRNRKDFLGTLIADLTLQIMSAFAQIERDSIRKRQAEGIAAAKARGVRFGRQALPRPENFSSVFDLWSAGKISARKAGKILGVAHQTFLKWARAENN